MAEIPPIIFVNKTTIIGRQEQFVIIEMGEDVRPNLKDAQSIVRVRVAMTPTVLLGFGKDIAKTLGYGESQDDTDI